MSSQCGLHTIGNLRWWVDLGWLQDIHLAALSLLLLKRMEGECRMKKSYGRDKNREIAFQYHRGQNRTNLVKINLLPIKINLDSQKQRQIKTFAPPLHFPWLNFAPSFLTLLPSPPAEWCSGVGKKGLGSVHSSSCLALLPPHSFPLPQCGFSPPWAAVLQERNLLQCGSSTTAVPSGHTHLPHHGPLCSCAGISLPFPNVLSQRCHDCC